MKTSPALTARTAPRISRSTPSSTAIDEVQKEGRWGKDNVAEIPWGKVASFVESGLRW